MVRENKKDPAPENPQGRGTSRMAKRTAMKAGLTKTGRITGRKKKGLAQHTPEESGHL